MYEVGLKNCHFFTYNFYPPSTNLNGIANRPFLFFLIFTFIGLEYTPTYLGHVELGEGMLKFRHGDSWTNKDYSIQKCGGVRRNLANFRDPYTKKVIFENPYSTKCHFRDPVYNKMSFLRPPIQQNCILRHPIQKCQKFDRPIQKMAKIWPP